MASFKVGQLVETTTHPRGVIRYSGPIHVAEGSWLGIELPDPVGKNDGSVRGERYFDCPPLHGLFIKGSSVVRVLSEATKTPPTAATTTAKATTTAPVPKGRPTSQKPTSRTSTVSKRQSVAAPPTSLRAPVRKPSLSSLSSSAAPKAPSTATTARRSSRDSSVETLYTKLRHLEKQHSEDQERLKELNQARDERDRFHTIIQKLQAKCQTSHQDLAEQKALLQQLQSDNDKLSITSQEHEIDLEDAIVDREMAQERAEQAEAELETLRAKLEERDMELDILRSEAELFTTEMSQEEREEAGYYRLQHENDRLRQALVALKEMTTEQEHDSQRRIRELQQDVSSVDELRQEAAELKDQASEHVAIIEHLRAQVDASAEWEDVSNDLTAKNQELEDKVTSQGLTIQDLESLRELNDELELQHAQEEEEMRAELDAKYIELAEQYERIETQHAEIVDQEDLIGKFRGLVLDLQSRMHAAESSKIMTDAQVKDATGRFNEVMDINRQLRAATLTNVSREIDARLSTLAAAMASEELKIFAVTKATEFQDSQPMRCYFTAKRVASKANILSKAIESIGQQISTSGRLDETFVRLDCNEAVGHLSVIHLGSERLARAIAASPLPLFANFGPAHGDLSTVEKSLDYGLDAVKTDGVNFAELAGSLKRSNKIQHAILTTHEDALAARPGDVILGRIQSIALNLEHLNATFDIVNTTLQVSGQEGAQRVLEHYAGPSAVCTQAMSAARKLLKTTLSLHQDSLYPHILGGLVEIIEVEALMDSLAREAAEWGHNVMRVVSTHFDADGMHREAEADWEGLLQFQGNSDLHLLNQTSGFINSWTEDAVVLMNCTEIQKAPTPWSQKAKEAAIAREQNLEAATLLEQLEAQHKATLLVLYEREQALDTKELEIEHLGAKHRDATLKISDNQQLLDKIEKLQRELQDVLDLCENQRLEMAALQTQLREDSQNHVNPAMSSPPVQDIPQKTTPQSERATESLHKAMADENHWLRQREHRDIFERGLMDLFDMMHDVEEPPTTEQHPATSSTVMRPKMPPLVLGSVQTSWQSHADSIAGEWQARESPAEWEMLPIIEEEEQGNTMDLEGFSSIDDTMKLAGFSEVLS